MPSIHPECEGQEQGKEESLGTGDQLHHVPSSSFETHTGKNEEPVITSM
jgi:hypothetical protein